MPLLPTTTITALTRTPLSPPHHHHHHQQTRTFINARIKWVRDQYLDNVVQREKNLFHCLSLKNLILTTCPSPSPSPSPSSTPLSLPLSLISQHTHFPTSSPLNFLRKYPSLFRVFTPRSRPRSLPLVRVTPKLLALHKEEEEINDCMSSKVAAAHRLVKLLMLTHACKLPVSVIDGFKFDLGFDLTKRNHLLELVSYFPDCFRLCSLKFDENGDDGGGEKRGKVEVGLELVKWRGELAVPAVVEKGYGGDLRSVRGRKVEFPMSFTPGFDLQKRVLEWLDEWNSLPYISPYEDAFHLAPTSDQAEKYTVAVLHEILSILVSKKTEARNLFRLGDYLGFGSRFKKALRRYPGIFYVSNKIRTQTVVLREAFKKDLLIEKHPLMGMRHRYIYLMNKSGKPKKLGRKLVSRRISHASAATISIPETV